MDSYNEDGTSDYDDGLHDKNDNHCDHDRKIAGEATGDTQREQSCRKDDGCDTRDGSCCW